MLNLSEIIDLYTRELIYQADFDMLVACWIRHNYFDISAEDATAGVIK